MINADLVIKNLWICFGMMLFTMIVLSVVITPWLMVSVFFWLVIVIDVNREIKKEAAKNESKS